MVTYVATLDVPRHVVEYLARSARPPTGAGSALRRAPGPWARSARPCWCCAGSANAAACTAWPATPGSPRPPATATSTKASTCWPTQAPDLHEVLDRCRREGMTHVILDGTLIACDRLAGVRENGNDLWFSQKHKSFGGNVQFLAAPDGTPLWVSDVEPGSTPDITAARIHVLPALYKAAADGLPTLADKGYIGAGIGIHVPSAAPTATPRQALRRRQPAPPTP